MPVRTRKNQYLGVNPHLHSQFQQQGGWVNFHNPHIGMLIIKLKQQLFPMGYTANVEDSLQIRRVEGDSESGEPDIYISNIKPQRGNQTPTLSNPAYRAIELLDFEVILEKPYRAIGIYKRGQPEALVAWIELLSPANKRANQDRETYLSKRWLLENSIVFVEIDYLHTTPQTFAKLGDYTDIKQKEQAHPYRIVVIDPRPDLQHGSGYPYEFDVDQSIPTVEIPLLENNILRFDFNAAYHTFYEDMIFGLEQIDYTQFPMKFDSYSAADQARIANRMLAVLEAHTTGIDLETAAPLPVGSLPLNDAMQRIAALTTATE